MLCHCYPSIAPMVLTCCRRFSPCPLALILPSAFLPPWLNTSWEWLPVTKPIGCFSIQSLQQNFPLVSASVHCPGFPVSGSGPPIFLWLGLHKCECKWHFPRFSWPSFSLVILICPLVMSSSFMTSNLGQISQEWSLTPESTQNSFLTAHLDVVFGVFNSVFIS